MPRYDIRCPIHGVHEVSRPITSRDPFRCVAADGCDAEAQQVFTAQALVGARIDDQENVGAERGGDLGGFNLGLPGRTGADGKYRPWHGSEIGSNRRAREIARANNLTPVDGGRYRTTPR